MHADGETAPARLRTGGAVLSFIAGPLCVPILRAHLDGPLRLPDLRDRIGGAAQTTLRGQVGNLRGIGALERKVIPGMPYTVENDLSECGREILEVAGHVEAWLARAPHGPIALGSEAAKGSIRSLVAGWSSTVLRALAARPLALTDLNSLIKDLSYPALERRLSSMRAARQIEVLSDKPGKARPYAVTDWTRQAVVPLVAASRCECRHLPGTVEPLDRVDIETAFLLAVPLAALPADSTGSCLLAVSAPSGDGDGERLAPQEGDPLDRVAGVHVEVERGEVVSCVSRLEVDPRTWSMGSPGTWVETILDGRLDDLRFGGADQPCARGLIEAVHGALAPA